MVMFTANGQPAEAGRYDPNAFEDEYRHALRALADSGRAPEINTKTAPQSLSRYGQIVRWWRDEGGKWSHSGVTPTIRPR
jgi:histidinol-phosphatase (PHP family)